MPEKLTVAAVQFRSIRDLDDNVQRHCSYIYHCVKEGARVVVFPECSITGYFEDVIVKTTAKQLSDAEATIATAAKDAKVYVILGIPTKNESTTFNSAIVITPDGNIIERYHKIQLAGERWATMGDHISTFPIDGVISSIIVCHDERYPELVRLPVLAGAQIVFYISHESGITEEHKIEPYRAQIVARAVENTVYIVHANAPADKQTLSGSHGQSRIIKPNGNIIKEATIFEEEVLIATLDLNKATGLSTKQSLRCEFLRTWLEAGVSKVVKIQA
jgi:predicted amidohydrolase